MRHFKFHISNFTFTIIPLLLLTLVVFGCQKVEKPSREGTGHMAIIIDVDEAPGNPI